MVFWPRCPKQGIQFDFCPKQTFVLNKFASVLNRFRTCPKQGMVLYEPRDLNPDCEQSLSFICLRPRAGLCEKLKDLAIEQRTSNAFLFLICIISNE